MPRGPDARDARWFGEGAVPTLSRAVGELSWLLSRGYALPSSLALVGDRHQLRRRQRAAVWRAAASDDSVATRRRAHVPASGWSGRELLIDGFNALITIEVGLEGGPVLVGRDGASRDVAGVHGTYRAIPSTERAIRLALDAGGRHGASACHWFFDRNVSNSGRTADRVRALMREVGLGGEVAVVDSADPLLKRRQGIVCSSDGPVLDRVAAWTDMPGEALGDVAYWRIELGGPAGA